MFTSSIDSTSGGDFSNMGEGNKVTWNQLHIKFWGAQYLEGHAPVTMQNNTGRAVPLTWLLLDSKLTVDLIANTKLLVNIRMVREKGAIQVYCNSGVNIVNRVSDLPGYGTVWYKPTSIANILSMSRATKKFWVIFNSEGGIFQDGPPRQVSEVSVDPY